MQEEHKRYIAREHPEGYAVYDTFQKGFVRPPWARSDDAEAEAFSLNMAEERLKVEYEKK